MPRAPARRLQGFQMDRTPRAGAIVTFIALGLGIGPTGSSQESADLVEKIDRIERRMSTLPQQQQTEI